MQPDSPIDDAYRAPRAGHQGGGHIIYEDVQVFSFSQRLNRLRFACYSLTSWLLVGLLTALLAVLGGALVPKDMLAWVFVPYALVVGIGMLVYTISLHVRRLHDLGRSGWLVLILLSPLLAVPVMLVMPTAETLLFIIQLISPLFTLYLLVAAGEGMNQFGTPNPPNSFLVSFFGGLSWTVTVLLMLFQVAVVGAQYFAPGKLDGYLGTTPNSNAQQFERFLRELKKN